MADFPHHPALIQAAQAVAAWKAARTQLHDIPLDALNTYLTIGIEATRYHLALLRTPETTRSALENNRAIHELLRFDLQLHSSGRLVMLGFRAVGARMRLELEGHGWAAEERAREWGRAMALVKDHDEVMLEVKRLLEDVARGDRSRLRLDRDAESTVAGVGASLFLCLLGCWSVMDLPLSSIAQLRNRLGSAAW